MASFWMGLTKLLAYFFGLTLIQNIYQTLGAFPRLVKRTPRNFKNNTEILCSEPVIGIHDKLTYIQAMLAGALSRTIAQTVMHPANTYKTMLQMRRSGKMLDLSPERLFRGADAQFVMSLPHGAFYFSVIDLAKKQVSKFLPEKLGFLGDFAASTFSTIICSTVSTPQMVITDRLMGGVYPSFPHALKTILTTEGIAGFYTGWWPALAQKIPSYGLTWMFFQQLKRLYESTFHVSPEAKENFILGALGAAGSVCVMIPLDTIKTRLVTQSATCPMAYKGMRDCFWRVLKEEGIGAFYVSLPPRLASVVPMIAIQFCVYETLKNRFEKTNFEERIRKAAALAAKKKAQALNLQVKRVRKSITNRPRFRFIRKPKDSSLGSSLLDDETEASSDNGNESTNSKIMFRRWEPSCVGSTISTGAVNEKLDWTGTDLAWTRLDNSIVSMPFDDDPRDLS